MTRQIEYLVAGVVALYIVFLTRPAPAAVASVLANPIGQILALAAIVYVGSTQSLIVALLLGVAYVASVPGREFANDSSIKPKCKEGEAYNEKLKKCAPVKAPAPTKPTTKAPPANANSTAAPADGSKPPTPPEPAPASEKTVETFMCGGGIDYSPY